MAGLGFPNRKHTRTYPDKKLAISGWDSLLHKKRSYDGLFHHNDCKSNPSQDQKIETTICFMLHFPERSNKIIVSKGSCNLLSTDGTFG